MLEDPLMQTATAEILVGDRPRFDIQRDIKAKVRTALLLTVLSSCDTSVRHVSISHLSVPTHLVRKPPSPIPPPLNGHKYLLKSS